MLEPDSLAVVEVSMLSPFTTLSDDSPGMGEFMRLDLQPLQLQFIIIWSGLLSNFFKKQAKECVCFLPETEDKRAMAKLQGHFRVFL